MRCDAVAFAGMYETIYRDLYRFALCMMRNPQDAEDAVSESVIQGFEKIGSLRNEGAFKSWMFSILSNVCRRKLKRMARQQAAAAEYYEDIPDGSAEDRMEVGLDVRRAFAVLTEEEQMIVGLSVFGGYASGEIAKLMSSKDGTVRSKRSRALGKMSVALGSAPKSGRAGKPEPADREARDEDAERRRG